MNEIEKLYLKWGRENQRLESTRSFLNLWVEMCKRHKFHHKLDEYESVIDRVAKREWGKDTMIEFHRGTGRVIVVNTVKGRQEVIDDFRFLPEAESGPEAS